MIYRLAIPKWYFNNNQNRSLENILHTHTHTHTKQWFSRWHFDGNWIRFRVKSFVCEKNTFYAIVYFYCFIESDSFELFVCVASVRIVHVSADSISTAISVLCAVYIHSIVRNVYHILSKRENLVTGSLRHW